MQQDGRTRYALHMAAGATLISFAPVFVKLADATGMTPDAIAVWRTGIAFVVLLAVTAARFPAALRPRHSRDAAIIVLAAVLFAVDLAVWHRSIVIVGAGMATILGNTQVFWTPALAAMIYRERLARIDLIAAVVAFAGVVLLSGIGQDIQMTRRYLAGIGFGLGTGLAYACYLLALKGLSRRDARAVQPTGGQPTGHREVSRLARGCGLLTWIAGGSTFALAILVAIEGKPWLPPSPGAWASVAGAALVAQVIGWLVIYAAIDHLTAARAALLLLLQPAIATLWGWLWFAEHLTALQLVGAALTLGAVYWSQTARR